jgi:hypothetical protein
VLSQPRAQSAPDLTGRVARCSCGAERPSSFELAFFEFRGEGSKAATQACAHCGYFAVAHGPDAPRRNHGQSAVERAGCPGFEPHGSWDYDIYYCGCRGWN